MAQNLQPKTGVSSLTDISNNNPAIQSGVNSNLGANVETGKTQVPPKPKTGFGKTLPGLTSPIIESETVTPLTTGAKPTPFGRFLPGTRPTDVKSQNINPETPIGDAYIQSAKDQNFVSTQIQKAQELPQTMEGNMQAQDQISELKNTLEMQKVQAESQANEANQYVAGVADKNQMEANLKFKQQARDTELQQNLMTLNKNSNDFINKANSQISSMIQAGGGGSSKDLALLSQANSYYMQGVQSLENLHKSNSMQANLIQAEYDNYANGQLNKFLTDHSLTTIKTLGYISQLKASGQLYSAKGIQEAKQALLMNNIALSNSVARYSDSLKTATENLKYKADIEYRNASLAEQRRQFNMSNDLQRTQLQQNENQFQSSMRQSRMDKLLAEGYIDDMQYLEGIDFSTNKEVQNNNPRTAAFKNNNPTGMTWGISDNLKTLLTNAGIEYEIGTPRPKKEGGNYIKFKNVADGMKAYEIALAEAGSLDVYSRLKQWVGTSKGDSYATELMEQAQIPRGTNFDELTNEQLQKLKIAQLERESPNFLKEIGKLAPQKDLTMGPFEKLAAREAQAQEKAQAEVSGTTVESPTYTETQLDAMRGFSNDSSSRKKLNQAFPNMTLDERVKLVDEYRAKVNSPEANAYINGAMKYIPSNEKDNGAIQEKYKAMAEKMYLQGYSKTQAELAMVGLNLDKEGAGKIEQFKKHITGLKSDVDKSKLMKSFAELLSSGNEDEAFLSIENEGLASAKGVKPNATFSSSANVVNNVDRIIDLMNKKDENGKTIMDKLGPIEGQIEVFGNNWIPGKEIDTDTAEYATLLNNLFMEIRHSISGSAVTQSESEANASSLESSISAYTKNPKAVEITLRELKRKTIDQTNAVRRGVGLPLVDEVLLKNYNKSPKYIYIK